MVEVDGYGPHHSRRAFERDRRRDATLVAKGYSVIRVTWGEITEEPEKLVFRLGQALAARGVSADPRAGRADLAPGGRR